jgi:hypothetical protein
MRAKNNVFKRVFFIFTQVYGCKHFNSRPKMDLINRYSVPFHEQASVSFVPNLKNGNQGLRKMFSSVGVENLYDVGPAPPPPPPVRILCSKNVVLDLFADVKGCRLLNHLLLE